MNDEQIDLLRQLIQLYCHVSDIRSSESDIRSSESDIRSSESETWANKTWANIRRYRAIGQCADALQAFAELNPIERANVLTSVVSRVDWETS